MFIYILLGLLSQVYAYFGNEWLYKSFDLSKLNGNQITCSFRFNGETVIIQYNVEKESFISVTNEGNDTCSYSGKLNKTIKPKMFRKQNDGGWIYFLFDENVQIRYICNKELKNGDFKTECGMSNGGEYYLNLYTNVGCHVINIGFLLMIVVILISLLFVCYGYKSKVKDNVNDFIRQSIQTGESIQSKNRNEAKDPELNEDNIIKHTSDDDVKEFIKKSKKKKELKNKQFIRIDIKDIKKRKEITKKAKKLTKDILSKKSSGDPSKKDTVLHLFNKIQGGNCLFYDSSKGINCPDNQNLLVNLNTSGNEEKEPEFCLTLESLSGEYKDNDVKFNENEKMMELNNCIKSNKKHPILTDFKNKLAKVYNIKPSQVIIKDVYAGTMNIVYVLDLTEEQRRNYYKKDGNKYLPTNEAITNKMSDLFRGFQQLNLPAVLFRNSIDINMFDDRGNKTFNSGSTYKVGPKDREKDYTQPSGWVRYGLKVLNGKYGTNNKWLDPFQDPGNWYRVYHGTGSVAGKNIKGFGYDKMSPVDAMSNIYKGGFHMAGCTAYGPGVYCSPDPKWLESSYCGKISIDTINGTKNYKYMLQCCVNPDEVKCGSNTNYTKKNHLDVPFGSKEIFQAYAAIWVAEKPTSIRPYGILIKEY